MLVLIILACVLSAVNARIYPSYPANYNFLQYCGSSIYVQSDVRVSITSLYSLAANQVCTITLRPQSGDRLVAIFRNYNLSSYSYYDDSGNCQYESIQLTGDGSNKFGFHGYCGHTFPVGQYGLGKVATITVTNMQQFTWLYAPYVDVLFTEVYNTYSDNSCPNDKFNCYTYNTCIDKQLMCNGYNDCGNNWDETEGCKDPDPHIDINVNIAAIVGGSVGLVVLISAIVITVIVCRRRRGKAGYIQY